MSPKEPFQLTPEQIALSAERKAKKQNTKFSQSSDNCPVAGAIVNRAWIPLPISLLEDARASDGRQQQEIKVLTWNVCLSLSQ
jgi:hypothetical protein